MKTILFIACSILYNFSIQAQEYSIKINGQSFDVKLDRSFTYITENGDSVAFTLQRTGTPIEQTVPSNHNTPQSANTEKFEDSFLQFTYPANYAIAVTQPVEDFQQITMIDGNGGGIIIQEFSSMDPTDLSEFFLLQLVDNEAAEIQKVKMKLSGKNLKGLTTTDKDGRPISIYAYNKRNSGILLTIIGDESQPFVRSLIETMRIK